MSHLILKRWGWLACENIDLAGKHLPGTIKIPLEMGIAIGVEDDGNNK
jgi:hypothetical protein